jgi:hypothetical protein
LPVATLSGTHVEHAGFRNTGMAVAASRSASAQHREQQFGQRRCRTPGNKSIAAAATCATSTAQSPTLGVQLCRTLNVNGGMGDGGCVMAAACFRRPEQEDSKSEQQSRTGPFAGPKPESIMVPRGASRSNPRAHPSRLSWARRFLPSWPCEFDSRHPLNSKTPSQLGHAWTWVGFAAWLALAGLLHQACSCCVVSPARPLPRPRRGPRTLFAVPRTRPIG